MNNNNSGSLTVAQLQQQQNQSSFMGLETCVKKNILLNKQQQQTNFINSEYESQNGVQVGTNLNDFN